MPGEDHVSQTLKNIQEWDEWGRRLNAILQDVQQKTGETPLYITEEGEAFAHPDVLQKLQEPGNEGPLEFLQYMKHMPVPQDWFEE